MQTTPPYFKYRSKSRLGKHGGCIELEGEVIHTVNNIDEFHKTFGYGNEQAKAGIMPEEFIWEEYFRDAANKSTSCFQIHLIDYLIRHSLAFRARYADQVGEWFTLHARSSARSGVSCGACNARCPAKKPRNFCGRSTLPSTTAG
jgi:hypothetical protein